MTFDTIEHVGNSEVHHGSLNDRVYLKELHYNDLDWAFHRVENLAKERNYGKIVGKVPQWALETFLNKGYRVEAEIPGLYKGDTHGYFLCGYPNKQRVLQAEKEERFIASVKTIALATSDTSPKTPAEGLDVEVLSKSDMSELAGLHARAFSSYPYPVFEESYLEECLDQGFEFYGLKRGGELLESAMVHFNRDEAYAEIIDFAIPIVSKGQNLSYHILEAIITDAQSKEVKTLFSSIRATSYGLNITFRKQGFQFGGTLVNNTRVGDAIESMNIWYRNLH